MGCNISNYTARLQDKREDLLPGNLQKVEVWSLHSLSIIIIIIVIFFPFFSFAPRYFIPKGIRNYLKEINALSVSRMVKRLIVNIADIIIIFFFL